MAPKHIFLPPQVSWDQMLSRLQDGEDFLNSLANPEKPRKALQTVTLNRKP